MNQEKKDIPIGQLRALGRLAVEGSFANMAPGKKGIQSSYCSQLRKLSARVGTELHEREGRKIVLTPAGHELSQLATKFLSELDDFTNRCRRKPSELVIAGGYGIVPWVVIPQLSSIRRSLNEDVSFRVENRRTQEIWTGLHDGHIDFGILLKKQVRPHHKHADLGSFDYQLVIPTSLLRKEEYSDASLQRLPWAITVTKLGPNFRQIAQINNLRVEVICQSFQNAVMAMKHGYATILPSFVFSGLKSDKVEFILKKPAFLDPFKSDVVLSWNSTAKRIATSASFQKAISVLLKLLKI